MKKRIKQTILLMTGLTVAIGSQAATFKTIHGFTGAPDDGGNPWYGSSLINSGTTLYGMTKSGGSRTNGTLFKINTTGSGFQILHSFAGYDIGLDPAGSKNDGASPYGTPALSGATLYGMTSAGGSNGMGTMFKINTDGSGFQIMHHFGGVNDGSLPFGNSLLLSGTMLYGMTSQGGTNFSGLGTVFKIETNGSGYEILHSFQSPNSGATPWGSLALSGSTLYGMTSLGGTHFQGTVFRLETNGAGYEVIRHFSGGTNDGAHPNGSLVVSGSMLYGMTYYGGASGVGTIFQLETNGANFQLHHSFAFNEAYGPWGDLALSGGTLYGMTQGGVTNYHGSPLGGGSVFQIDTDGSNYRMIHTFLFPIVPTDGNMPFGSPLVVGSTLYGMTDLGGGPAGAGSIFSLTLGSGTVDTTIPTVTITAPTANQNVTSPGFAATGTAADNVAVSGVYYRLNNGDWTTATGTNNWSAPLTLSPGPNVFSAYAMDTSGNLSKTSSVSLVYVQADSLSVGVNGQGSVTPNLNGQSLQIGNTFKLTAKAATGFKFIDWTSSLDGVLTNNPALSFVMRSNLVLTARFADGATPVLAITAPKAGLRASNELYTASGTAKDNFGVEGVYYQLNGGDWNPATTGNNWSNWTAGLNLLAGTNVLSVYALDAATNSSPTNTLRFVYVVSAPLTVQIVGQGTVTPNYNGSLLAISNNYTVTAKAAKGFAFQSWTGDAPTNLPKLSFMMRSNLMLVANFVDITRPVNAVTLPGVNKTVTNSPFTAAGKAKDNAGVSNVVYQLNGAGWWPAATTNAFTNWTADGLVLLAGANLLQAFGLDAAGNASLTNSVKFNYKVVPVTDWAPDTLNGLLAQVQPSNGSPESVTFDLATFSQAGPTGDTNSDDYSVGGYGYIKTGTNTAQLTLTNAAPPNRTNEDPIVVELIFTNHYSGIFTNEGGDSGGVNASVSSAFVPATVAGKKLAVKSAGNLQTTTVALGTDGSFTKTPTNSGAPGASAGTYTFTRYSPAAGLIVLTFTGPDAGTVAYVQVTFTSATAGGYFVSVFDNTGAETDDDTGTFTLK